jgi:hypothetical protein
MICRTDGGKKTGRANQSPHLASRIPHDLTWNRTRAAAVGTRRISIWAMFLRAMKRTFAYIIFWLNSFLILLMMANHSGRAARSKAWTVFARSKAVLMGSNPTQGMNVCVRLFCVQVAALRWADHSSRKSYCLCKNNYWTEEEARAQQRAVEALMNENQRTLNDESSRPIL